MNDNLPIPDILKEKPPRIEDRRWFREEYEGMEEDIIRDLTSVFFWKKWDGKDDKLTGTVATARAMAEAVCESVVRAGALQNGMERAYIWGLYKLQEFGIYSFLPQEYDTLYGFLQDKQKETDRNSGQWYDIKALLEDILPALEKAGMPVAKLMAMPEQWGKTCRAVPSLRKALQQNTLETEAAERKLEEEKARVQAIEDEAERLEREKKALEEAEARKQKAEDDLVAAATSIFDKVADPAISFSKFNKEITKGDSKLVFPKLPVEVYLLPREEMWVIRMPPAYYPGAFKQALRGLIEDPGTPKDGFALIRELVKTFLGYDLKTEADIPETMEQMQETEDTKDGNVETL